MKKIKKVYVYTKKTQKRCARVRDATYTFFYYSSKKNGMKIFFKYIMEQPENFEKLTIFFGGSGT